MLRVTEALLLGPLSFELRNNVVQVRLADLLLSPRADSSNIVEHVDHRSADSACLGHHVEADISRIGCGVDVGGYVRWLLRFRAEKTASLLIVIAQTGTIVVGQYQLCAHLRHPYRSAPVGQLVNGYPSVRLIVYSGPRTGESRIVLYCQVKADIRLIALLRRSEVQHLH